MSIQRVRLPSSPITSPQPLPLPCFFHSAVKSSLPSQPACKISAGISDQNSKQGSHDHDTFLVDKETTQIGVPFESSLHQHAREDQVHDDLQPSITREGIDEIQGKRHSNKEPSIQASEELREEEAIKKGSTRWHGSSSGPPVTPIVSLPSASTRPGKKLLLKLWKRELEKEEEEEEEEEISGESERQRKIAGVLEQENVDDNYNNQRTRSINCIMNCQSDVPFPISDCVKHRQKGNASKEATVEQYGKLILGRKRKANDQSVNFQSTIKYEAKESQVRGGTKKVKGHCFDGYCRYPGEQKQKRGRPKKVKDQLVDGIEDVREQERKKGSPKKVKHQLVNENECQEEKEQNKERLEVTYLPVNDNEYGGEQKRKRGRPKKVKDQLVIENEYGEDHKQKKERPEKVKDHLVNDKDHLVNDKHEGELKQKRGRPKKVTDQLDDDKYVEKPKQRRRRRRRLRCCFILC